MPANNKVYMNEYMKKYGKQIYKCEICDKEMKINAKSRHQKSKTHLRNMLIPPELRCLLHTRLGSETGSAIASLVACNVVSASNAVNACTGGATPLDTR